MMLTHTKNQKDEIECIIPNGLTLSDYKCELCGETVHTSMYCDFNLKGYHVYSDLEPKYTLNTLRRDLEKLKLKGIQVVDDGSIEDDETTNGWFSAEIKVLCNKKDMSNLKKVCAFLKSKGAYVNKTCGLHVHLDVRGYDQDKHMNVAYNLESSIKYMTKIIDKSRLDNDYCEPRMCFYDRYVFVNASNLNTIEVRAHHGTIDYDTIYNWCVFLHRIKTAKNVKNYTFKAFKNSVKLPKSVTTWYNKQKRKLGEFI